MHNMTRYMVKTPKVFDFSNRGKMRCCRRASSQSRLFELLACVNTLF